MSITPKDWGKHPKRANPDLDYIRPAITGYKELSKNKRISFITKETKGFLRDLRVLRGSKEG